MVTAESRQHLEQIRLDGLKTAAERNRLGQFATPGPLAVEIAHFAFELWKGRDDQVDFLDPAIGTGSFYSAVRQVFPAGSVRAATGIEIDSAFAETARALWRSDGLNVVEGDFTKQTARERFNLILTNPPYIRHHHLDLQDKRRLKNLVAERLRLDVSGLAGFYCHYLLLCDDWMKEGGLAFWLIPSEFMDVNYGKVLKEYLTERVKLLRIHRFTPADVQFGDALVTSAVVIFEKAAPSSGADVVMTLGGSLSEPTLVERFA